MDIRQGDVVLVPMMVAAIDDQALLFTANGTTLGMVRSVQHRFEEGDPVQSTTGVVGKVIAVHKRWVLVERTDASQDKPSVFGIDELTRIQATKS